ncbi:flagellar export chaperone FliS [Paenibacillus solani]|uniref:flagellar export chaperone FliS n=1 Tax=Paenibacillus solani TaxID=1705565 RepID=UPI003D29E589
MSVPNYQQTYLNVRVETSSPGELTLILYEEFYKKLLVSKKLLGDKTSTELMRQQIFKAKEILNELMITLNMDYEISQNLYDLYVYYNKRLADFLIQQDLTILDEVIEFGYLMVDTWKAALKSLKTGNVQK